MGDMWFYSVGYYIWWMLINGLIYFFEFFFLQNISGIRKKEHMIFYLLLSVMLTFLVMRFESPGIWRLVLHAGMIICFSMFFLKLKRADAVTPVAIILTLCTFMEGFQTVLMQWFVQQDIGPFVGAAVQMTVSGVLAALLVGSLWVISVLLSNENWERKRYLEEAKKRNEQYRAFQHDIDNHFLVLSGLIHEKRYGEAESYSQNLSSLSDDLLAGITTGNLAADILLKEKTAYAKTCGIHVSCDAHFSAKYAIEDVDLCILLANAMDNAIQACVKEKWVKPEISVTAGINHHFLMIHVINTERTSGKPVIKSHAVNNPAVNSIAENSRGGDRRIPFGEKDYGTGLKNIKRVVKKYEGTMEIERNKDSFSLTMLLCLKPSAKGE